MKIRLWFAVALAALSILSCGRRNASEVFDPYNGGFQKPGDENSSFSVSAAWMVDSQQMRLNGARFYSDGRSEEVWIHVDEKQKSISFAVNGLPSQLGAINCLVESQGLCRTYDILMGPNTKLNLQHRKNLKITTRIAGQEVVDIVPMVFIQQSESGATWAFVTTGMPVGTILHWRSDLLILPNFSLALQPLAFALPGKLSEPVNMYEYMYENETYNSDSTVIRAHYQHRVTLKQEVVEWELREE